MSYTNTNIICILKIQQIACSMILKHYLVQYYSLEYFFDLYF